MPPPKSDVWTYFKKINSSTAICKQCSRSLKTSGNTSNLMKHLKSHGIDTRTHKAKGCYSDDTPRPSTSKDADIILNEETKLEQDSLNEGCETHSISSVSTTTITSDILQSFKTIKSFEVGGVKHSEISNTIDYFICADNRPFSTVEGRGFKKLMKTVCPLYKLPSREYFKSNIDLKYDIMHSVYKQKMSEIEHFCLTMDIWSEMMTGRSFLGVTAHFIHKTRRNSISLDVKELCDRHNAAYISEQLKIILNSWDINEKKVVAIVTDNGANMVAAVRLMEGNQHIPCFAHIINLIAETPLSNPQISTLIDKVRNIVKWIKNSVILCDDLRNRQRQNNVKEGLLKKVILDVKTRWNSTFYMLERFIELSSLISEIHFGRRNAPPMVDAGELEAIAEIMKVLKPLEYMSKELSGEDYITASRVFPMINCAMHTYENNIFEMEESKLLNNLILTEMRKRLSKAEHIPVLAVSTLLDPRFKNIHFKDSQAAANAISFVRRLLKHDVMPETPERNNLQAERSSKILGGY
ncbi:E3 SUMO-protein ligase ZBED1-like [Harmonia axyridis]|uniref:E3 SUMO-protein ligase ZBED1-like n=1 Tax=Harmonia axyridis TaxID=115357 RepID=UPI001E276F50|nr:E3 SUMO-protein ligase ZBED1-like [Harmonia axyridis]